MQNDICKLNTYWKQLGTMIIENRIAASVYASSSLPICMCVCMYIYVYIYLGLMHDNFGNQIIMKG